MYMTAAVFNAGLGDLSLGLEKAGFHVIAAYETDHVSREIHKANINAPVYPLPPEGADPETVSAAARADLLAARLYSQLLSSPASDNKASGFTADDFLMLLEFYNPKAFLIALGAGSLKKQKLEPLLKGIAREKFQYKVQLIDVSRVVGTPVADRNVFIAGTRADIAADFYFPRAEWPAPMPLENFLQSWNQVDPWYFDRVWPDRIPINRDGSLVYCWKDGRYAGTERVYWNAWKVPLVDAGGILRKMTHGEIAVLKGFPSGYIPPLPKNRSRLYQKLMYAVNVTAIEKLAEEMARSLMARPPRERRISAAMAFEELFSRYLTNLPIISGEESAKMRGGPNSRFDFTLRLPDQAVYLELKYYHDRYIPSARIKKMCEQLAPVPENGKAVLVITSEVDANTKRECLEQFRTSIWDVGNLLWQFDKFREIKNDFVALLDYSVADIEPSPPEFSISSITQEEPAAEIPPAEAVPEDDEKTKSGETDWKQRLNQIAPGKEQFQEYEDFCVEILKYILGDYLTLWEVQERTGDGLHRFDLCCKIKSGVKQDFFDTIKNYFNTKYIVFEFKNYSEEITQKEIFSTEKYLYGTALRKVAIIVSRRGCDRHALQAAKGSLRESGKLILCLTEDNLLEMANIKAQGVREPPELLSNMLDRLLIHLEK